MSGTETFVIVGAGHGAGQAVVSLRQKGFAGRIVLIGDEPYIPYQRPPLSKAYLAGDLTLDRLFFKPSDFYAQQQIELMLGTKAARIDRGAKHVHVHDGRHVAYDKLLIMTGSRVRPLDVPGVRLPGVHYLRSIADVDAIREHFADGAKLVVVGGGYIGLEVAAVAVKHGLSVAVLEAADRVMPRAVGPEVAEFFAALHRHEGVAIKTRTGVVGFAGKARLEHVLSAAGDRLPADIAVVGIGIVPNQEIAAEAGLRTDNGIVVDECCRTDDAAIFAAGDCTNHPCPVYGRRVRLESVHNAVEQAKTAAAAMLGDTKRYDQVPWFWSDQYDVKFQIAGLNHGYDQVVLRGDPKAARKFAAFYLKQGKLIAVDAVNAAQDYMLGRKLIGQGVRPDPLALADPAVSLKDMA